MTKNQFNLLRIKYGIKEEYKRLLFQWNLLFKLDILYLGNNIIDQFINLEEIIVIHNLS